jgi:hypothetical protein
VGHGAVVAATAIGGLLVAVDKSERAGGVGALRPDAVLSSLGLLDLSSVRPSLAGAAPPG